MQYEHIINHICFILMALNVLFSLNVQRFVCVTVRPDHKDLKNYNIIKL